MRSRRFNRLEDVSYTCLIDLSYRLSCDNVLFLSLLLQHDSLDSHFHRVAALLLPLLPLVLLFHVWALAGLQKYFIQ